MVASANGTQMVLLPPGISVTQSPVTFIVNNNPSTTRKYFGISGYCTCPTPSYASVDLVSVNGREN